MYKLHFILARLLGFMLCNRRRIAPKNRYVTITQGMRANLLFGAARVALLCALCIGLASLL